MKKTYFLLFILSLFVLISFSGCDKSNPSEPVMSELYIDAESGFNNETVIIKVDNNIIYSGKLNTNYSISAAWSSGLLIKESGKHNISVTIPEKSVSKSYSFNLDKILTVSFSYMEYTNSIFFNEFKGIIFRD